MRDAELSEDARKVSLDRPIGDEQRGRDLAIRLSPGDEARDTFLGGGERARRGRTTADSAKLTASALRPERRADPFEEGEGFLQRRARLSSSVRASLRNPEREQRSGVVERDLDPAVPRERLLEVSERSLEITRPGQKEPSAAEAVGERRGALEPTSVVLVPFEDLHGVVSPPELYQSLDQIDGEPARAGFGDGLPANELERWLELRNSLPRRGEDEREVAERLTGDEAHVVFGGRFEHTAGCVSRLLGTTQLGLNKGLEREVVPGEESLSRLGGRLLPGSGTIERGFEISEKTLDVAKKEQKPWPSVLVAEVVCMSHQVDEHRAAAFVRIDPLPVLGKRDEWLVEDAPVRRGVLECCSPVGRRLGGGSAQQRLCRKQSYEHVRGKRLVADLQGERQGDLGVPEPLLESLEHPEAARGEALVGDRECLAIALRLFNHLGEELGRLVRRLVEADTRQNHGGSRTLRTR